MFQCRDSHMFTFTVRCPGKHALTLAGACSGAEADDEDNDEQEDNESAFVFLVLDIRANLLVFRTTTTLPCGEARAS